MPRSIQYNDVIYTIGWMHGFLIDFNQWDENWVYYIAQKEKIILTNEHWEIINLIRNHYKEHNEVIRVRLLTSQMDIEISHFYSLFNRKEYLAHKMAGLSKELSKTISC